MLYVCSSVLKAFLPKTGAKAGFKAKSVRYEDVGVSMTYLYNAWKQVTHCKGTKTWTTRRTCLMTNLIAKYKGLALEYTNMIISPTPSQVHTSRHAVKVRVISQAAEQTGEMTVPPVSAYSERQIWRFLLFFLERPPSMTRTALEWAKSPNSKESALITV